VGLVCTLDQVEMRLRLSRRTFCLASSMELCRRRGGNDWYSGL
jgi:hypothetical protein